MEFEKKTYTINEISSMLDINTSTLRNWEQEFELKVPRNNKNHRFYTDTEIDIFKVVRDGREKNYSIDTIKKTLEKYGIIQEQKTNSMSVMKLNQVTLEEFQDSMVEKVKDVISEMILEREENLKKEFENKIIEREDFFSEKVFQKIKDQMESENKKLMDYIAATREEEKKKGLFSKLFR